LSAAPSMVLLLMGIPGASRNTNDAENFKSSLSSCLVILSENRTCLRCSSAIISCFLASFPSLSRRAACEGPRECCDLKPDIKFRTLQFPSKRSCSGSAAALAFKNRRPRHHMAPPLVPAVGASATIQNCIPLPDVLTDNLTRLMACSSETVASHAKRHH
jgi:hypothetical protein